MRREFRWGSAGVGVGIVVMVATLPILTIIGLAVVGAIRDNASYGGIALVLIGPGLLGPPTLVAFAGACASFARPIRWRCGRCMSEVRSLPVSAQGGQFRS